MIDEENLEVELRAVPEHYFDGEVAFYTIEYRIKNEQLGWFRRMFNRWRVLRDYVSSYQKYTTWYTEAGFKEMKKVMRTLKDVKTFEEKDWQNWGKDKIFYMDYDSERSEGKD